MITLTANTINDTKKIAKIIAEAIIPNFHIGFNGPLGSGKTTLIRYILQSLGVKDAVRSPTFTIVEPYEIKDFIIYHFDLYRFTSNAQWLDGGFSEYLSNSLCLIEWPEMAAPYLNSLDWSVNLIYPSADAHNRHNSKQRIITITAASERGVNILNQLVQRL